MIVLGVGLPKCGTTSLSAALRVAGLRVGHQHVRGTGFGPLMTHAYARGEDPMGPMRDYGVVGATQLDFVNPWTNIWGQLDYGMLSEVARRHHGEVKFLLPTRPLVDHVRSIMAWQRGEFHHLLTWYRVPGLPAGLGAERHELAGWINWHYDNVRKLRIGCLLEFDITQDPRPKLSEYLGVEVRHWPWHLRNHSLDKYRQPQEA